MLPCSYGARSADREARPPRPPPRRPASAPCSTGIALCCGAPRTPWFSMPGPAGASPRAGVVRGAPGAGCGRARGQAGGPVSVQPPGVGEGQVRGHGRRPRGRRRRTPPTGPPPARRSAPPVGEPGPRAGCPLRRALYGAAAVGERRTAEGETYTAIDSGLVVEHEGRDGAARSPWPLYGFAEGSMPTCGWLVGHVSTAPMVAIVEALIDKVC